jgi:hypothetical protein
MESEDPGAPPIPKLWHQKKRFRLPAMVVVGLGLLVVVLTASITMKIFSRAQSRDVSSPEWLAVYDQDVRTLRSMNGQIDGALAGLQTLAEETASYPSLTPDQKQLGREYFAQIADACAAIATRANYHRDFVFFAIEENRRQDHIRGFLFCDVADLVVQEAGLRLMNTFTGDQRWVVVLDEEQQAFGLPADSFTNLCQSTGSPERTSRQFAARQYLKLLRAFPYFESAVADDESAWLLEMSESLHPRIAKTLRAQGFDITMTQAQGAVSDTAFNAWFPVQKNVANAMGNIRVRREGIYLVTREQVRQLRDNMLPGDIIVTRKNWYVSNAGIPGFWPHALLHVGTPEQMARFFDDEQVRQWCAEQDPDCTTLPMLLERRYAEAWTAYITDTALPAEEAGAAEELVHNCIMEAIAEGVGLHPAEESLHADAIGVMRPRLAKKEIAIAIERAFSHYGKPYDYNFDFVTDNELVCSELVFKSYHPSAGYGGLLLKTTEMLGRPTLPPSDIVKKFDLEWNSPEQQLDFVGFLDPREGEAVSVWASEDEFRRSWMRPKWSVYIK